MVAVNLKERFKNGELDLSSCGLKEIPKEISTLKHITSLNLSNNKISSVGKIIGNLSHLNKLDLSRNQIKGLPENIGNLSNLKHLNLSHNQIATLPPTFGNLKNLKHLDLKNNHLAQKFSEIVGSCQNESQCQQAAKNVLKALASQSDSDKKKKQNLDQESKKKKVDKKQQNGGINQKQQKERKPRKGSKGVVQKIFDVINSVLKQIFIITLICVISVYAISFYDENRYKGIITKFHPVWRLASTRVLGDDLAVKLEAVLINFGVRLNQVIVTAVQMSQFRLKQLYVYLSTDETIQHYISNVKNTTKELWVKVSSGASEQKS